MEVFKRAKIEKSELTSEMIAAPVLICPTAEKNRIIEKHQFCTVNNATAVDFSIHGCFVIVWEIHIIFKSRGIYFPRLFCYN